MSANIELIKKLRKDTILESHELKQLLTTLTKEDEEFLYSQAREVKKEVYGDEVYIRGLIEFTNYCKKDCVYCGIRASNRNADRYRLSFDEIMECTDLGYGLGFRTFVLQGGEDPFFTDDYMCEIIRAIKQRHADCAITLSIGEKSHEAYVKFYEAGADRYLLRHETINPEHYSKIHSPSQSIATRVECLKDLKSIGYQVGCGIMIGSPYQTVDNIVEDLLFMKSFQPHMIGMGPFIANHDTPFADMPNGKLEDTLHVLAITRLMQPNALLPATTALGSINKTGREQGILAGGNVVMPNLSPTSVRAKYALYDGKICTGDEAAECIMCLTRRVETTGNHIANVRGDSKVEFKDKSTL